MSKLSLFYLSIFVFTIASNAAAEEDSWSNVYKFQKKMADMGNVKAQYILGEMYEEGRGVKQNANKAITWYTTAQKNGHKKAANSITRVRNKIQQAKLQAEKVIKKIVKPTKKASGKVKKSKPLKSVLIKNKKVKSTASSITKTNRPIANKSQQKSVAKKVQKNFSPEDFSRAKGTHMDDFEDPFD